MNKKADDRFTAYEIGIITGLVTRYLEECEGKEFPLSAHKLQKKLLRIAHSYYANESRMKNEQRLD